MAGIFAQQKIPSNEKRKIENIENQLFKLKINEQRDANLRKLQFSWSVPTEIGKNGVDGSPSAVNTATAVISTSVSPDGKIAVT